jgi:hypothetical protein
MSEPWLRAKLALISQKSKLAEASQNFKPVDFAVYRGSRGPMRCFY